MTRVTEIVIIILISLENLFGCPENCRCIDNNTKVICMNIQTLSTAELPLSTQKFILTGNHMVEFPADAFQHLKKLTSLGLTFNKLSFIPTNLSRYFPHLKEFFLTGNEIEQVRPLYGLDAIEILNLDNNRIGRMVPGCFMQLKNLKELSLQGNDLVEMPANIFYGLKKLRKVDLSHNKIKRINRYIFNTLSSLTEINLSWNKLLTIPSETFLFTKKLTSIHLSKNSIIKIADGVFSNLTVDMIDLRFNNLNKVPIRSFRNLTVAGEIYMDGNKINCDCELHQLLQTELKCWFVNRKLIFGQCPSRGLLFAETLHEIYKNNNCSKIDDVIKCDTNYVDLFQDDDREIVMTNMTSSATHKSFAINIINEYGLIIAISFMSLVAFSLFLNLIVIVVKGGPSKNDSKEKRCRLLTPQAENKEDHQ